MTLISIGLALAFVTATLDYFKDFYWEKIKNIFPSLTKTFFGRILFILTIIGLLISAFSSFESQRQIENQKYAYYSTIDLEGQTHVGRFSAATEIGLEMKDLVFEDNGSINTNCDIKVIDKVISSFPLYPFGYYFKAGCLLISNDSGWQDSAREAKRIFKITTQFSNHSIDHEYALKKLEDLLSGKNETLTTF